MGNPIDRRTALRHLGLGAVGLAVAGCSNGGGERAGSTGADLATVGPTTSAPPATSSTAATVRATASGSTVASTSVAPAGGGEPTVYDPAQSLWSQGNYAPVADEATVDSLEVVGSLPPELDGLYVRNGSNPMDPSIDAHWFVGDGMLHGVRLEAGRASWYRNRWVRTPVLGKDPFGAGVPGGANNTSNTSVTAFAGRLLTMEEIGFPFEISPVDLATVGPFDFGGDLRTAMTAHPKLDPETGLLHFFGYGFTPPFLTYHVASPDGRLVHSTEIALPAPSMVHDFAVTATDVVFWDLPVIFSMDAAIAGSTMPFRWTPGNGARVGVMPLGGTGDQIRWVEIDPCFVYHGTNAWREGDDVVLDVSRIPDSFATDDERVVRDNRVERWRLGTAGPSLTFSAETVVDRAFDLPMIDAAALGRPHGRAYYVEARNASGGYEFGGLASVARTSGAVDAWEPGFGFSAGEPCVVGDWVLAFVFDRAEGTSRLDVFEADSLAAGPVASVLLPRRVPFGFHGTWLPGGRA